MSLSTAAPAAWEALSNKRHLQRLAAREGALGVGRVGRAGLVAWQAQLRARLWDLLGGPAERVELEPTILERHEDDGFTRELVRYWTEPGVAASAWLLTPPRPLNGGSRPGVLALHGHGAGKDDTLALNPSGDPAEAARIAESNYGYGRALAQRGYVVLAPDARGFGERSAGSEAGCHIAGEVSLYLGRPLPGQRLWDDMRGIDFLQSLPAVDPGRVGCVGLSEGGKRSLLLAALDERIRVAVVSGYFTRLRGEVAAWDRLLNWDVCNPIPGLLRWADLPDIASLVAPRPLLIENGRADELYSVDAVLEGYGELERVWRSLDAPDDIGLDLFDGGHRWNGGVAYSWLDRALGHHD